MTTFPPTVAGTFYPGEPRHLEKEINHLMDGVAVQNVPSNNIKALIVPHAGYIYSGSVAASAYACLQSIKHVIRRVVLFGPAHRHRVNHLVSHSADFFSTPLGKITIDHALLEQLRTNFKVEVLDHAFEGEHCLEVQLPFIQTLLEDFTLLPILTGADSVAESSDLVQNIIEFLWQDKETLVIISTDLSHFHPYDEAKKIDAITIDNALKLKYKPLDFDHACGLIPLTGMIKACIKLQGEITLLDAGNSGDTAGDRNRVVGYASFVVHQFCNNNTSNNH